MGLRFCMLESVNGGQVAVNVDAVVAVRADGGQAMVVHQSGQIAVKGIVAEVTLKLLGAAGAPEAEVKPRSAA